VLPAAVIEIGLSVVVDKGHGVDGLGAVDVFLDEGFAEGIFEWAGGGFAGCDADACTISGGEIHVVGVVAFDDTGCPRSFIR
jgi:hypothetical protein